MSKFTEWGMGHPFGSAQGEWALGMGHWALGENAMGSTAEIYNLRLCCHELAFVSIKDFQIKKYPNH
ncbi:MULTISPECIES: hypothetical protein [unclassified Calothrix]|uniref:hypothetical protein n=1 Tax=unclassified Calothrix TaxID=2619626 RepID=UPI0030DA7554